MFEIDVENITKDKLGIDNIIQIKKILNTNKGINILNKDTKILNKIRKDKEEKDYREFMFKAIDKLNITYALPEEMNELYDSLKNDLF